MSSGNVARSAQEWSTSKTRKGEVDTILCTFCQATIHFAGLPALRYQDHLCKEMRKIPTCKYYKEILISGTYLPMYSR